MSDAPTGPEASGAVVVGGGLAGMVAALRLAEGGMAVDLYEASSRFGGKAGSDWREDPGRLGYRSDHGYHVFPAWYANVWALIAELGIEHQFQRRRHFWRLPLARAARRRGDGLGLWLTQRLAVISPRSLLTAVDLLSRDEEELEGVSLADFIASRWYNGPGTGRELRDISLKGLGNPPERASAITFRANMAQLLPVLLRPNWTAARGPLQDRFIQPLVDALEAAGVHVHLATPLTAIDLGGAADTATVRTLTFADGLDVPTPDRPVVLALPHERLGPLLAPHRNRLPDALSGLDGLCSRPMVAVDVHLRRRLHGLAKRGHVILDGSRFHLTLLDIRPLWTDGLPGDPGLPVLQVIAADTRGLGPGEEVGAAVLADLRRFFPFLRDADIDRVVPHPNADAPLFMNEVGTDGLRPRSDRAHGTNLFVAGDWCHTPVDLACMEGAVVSGTQAAATILAARGGPAPPLSLPDTRPRRRTRIARIALAPVCWLLGQPFDLADRLRHRSP